MKILSLSSLSQLQDFASKFTTCCVPATCIFLKGDLGVGKTTFVRACLDSLGYQGKVRSPTFTIVEEYMVGTLSVYHADLYRISGGNDLEDIGMRDYFTQNSCIFIEWPEKGSGFLPVADIVLEFAFKDDGREISITSNTDHGENLLSSLIC